MLFWDVDTQVDFMLPGGRLYVPGAEKIVEKLARLTACARDRQFPLIASACAHRPGDPELATYGPHCMAGTPGQRKIAETLLPLRYVVPNRPVKLPELQGFQQIVIEKQAFDVFTNPNTEEVLRQVGEARSIVLYGVVTEICVAATARALLERSRRVMLVSDAVRALDTARAKAFFEQFLRRGGQVITVEEAVALPPELAA